MQWRSPGRLKERSLGSSGLCCGTRKEQQPILRSIAARELAHTWHRLQRPSRQVVKLNLVAAYSLGWTLR